VATPAIGEHVGWQGAGVEAIIELVERFGGNGFTLGRDTSFTCYQLLPLLLGDGCHGVVADPECACDCTLESPFASAFTISSRIASEQYLVSVVTFPVGSVCQRGCGRLDVFDREAILAVLQFVYVHTNR
jgi:hypothetical protein